MQINLNESGLTELIEKLKTKGRDLGNEAASSAVANTAAMGRRAELKNVTGRVLEIGKIQTKSKKKIRVTRAFSKWMEKSGAFGSLSRSDKKGNPWKLSRFSWETIAGRKGSLSKARYTSHLANLWANPTKPYETNSPFVGSTHLKQWEKGEVRPRKINWSGVKGEFLSIVPSALQRTEVEIQKRIDEVFEK